MPTRGIAGLVGIGAATGMLAVLHGAVQRRAAHRTRVAFLGSAATALASRFLAMQTANADELHAMLFESTYASAALASRSIPTLIGDMLAAASLLPLILILMPLSLSHWAPPADFA